MSSGYNPAKKVRAVIVDGRISEEIQNGIKSLGINIVRTIKHPNLYEAISFHPDVVACPVGPGRVVVEPSMFEYYSAALAPYRVELIKGATELSSNYPGNIAYNIATIGKTAILYSKHADPVVIKELMDQNICFIEVKQGYTKCSTAIIDDNAIITSDKGIASAVLKNNVDVLLIRPAHIKLEGFEYGFIGGCCGKISRDAVLFAGDPSTHPDWNEIRQFMKKHHINPVKLCNGPLIDIGSIIPVVEIN